MKKRDKLVIVVFSVFTLAAGFIGRAVDMVLTEQPEGQSLGMLIWLILPLLISVIIRLTNKGYFEPVGFKMNFGRNAKIYAISLLIFMNPVSGIIPLAFILVLGLILRNRRVCRGEVLCQE